MKISSCYINLYIMYFLENADVNPENGKLSPIICVQKYDIICTICLLLISQYDINFTQWL